MAARLDGFVKGQKRFLGDVAHELASPIARMQLSLAILERKLEGKHGPDLRDVLEEVEHMSGLVNELLSFTRAEVNPGKVTLEEVDLRVVVERVVHREKGAMGVWLDLEPGLKAWADPDLLARALANLLRNAARYAGPEGPVEIVGWKLAGRVAVEVRDSGPGVPEAMLTQIFEPFFRPEPSRVREAGGVGLGLSIVKSCVEACQGEVTCRNLKPKGFAVTIFLNLSPRSQ
jgi:two-component system sensor histidine kinase CpxA